MRKIKFSLNLGIVGLYDSGKEIVIDYLKHYALKRETKEKFSEFLIIYQDIPIKIKLFNVVNFNQFIKDYEYIKRIDVLFVIIDIYNLNSFDGVIFKNFKEFNALYTFQGISMLIGVDKYSIENETPSSNKRISRFNLIKRTKDLNFQYCFEIQNNNRDILEILNKFLEIFALKLSNTNPELLEHAKSYGKELNTQSKL